MDAPRVMISVTGRDCPDTREGEREREIERGGEGGDRERGRERGTGRRERAFVISLSPSSL